MVMRVEFSRFLCTVCFISNRKPCFTLPRLPSNLAMVLQQHVQNISPQPWVRPVLSLFQMLIRSCQPADVLFYVSVTAQSNLSQPQGHSSHLPADSDITCPVVGVRQAHRTQHSLLYQQQSLPIFTTRSSVLAVPLFHQQQAGPLSSFATGSCTTAFVENLVGSLPEHLTQQFVLCSRFHSSTCAPQTVETSEFVISPANATKSCSGSGQHGTSGIRPLDRRHLKRGGGQPTGTSNELLQQPVAVTRQATTRQDADKMSDYSLQPGTNSQQTVSHPPPAHITNYIKGARSASRLLFLFNTYHPVMDFIHLAACLHRLAVVRQATRYEGAVDEEAELLELLLANIAKKDVLLRFRTREFSHILYSLAKLNIRMGDHGDIVSSIVLQLTRNGAANLGKATPQQLSNIVWGASKLGISQNKFWDAVVKVAPVVYSQPTVAHDWIELASGFAHVQRPDASIFDMVSTAVKSGAMTGATSLGYARLIWALGACRHHDSSLLDYLSKQLLAGGMKGAVPMDIHMMLAGYADLRHVDVHVCRLAVVEYAKSGILASKQAPNHVTFSGLLAFLASLGMSCERLPQQPMQQLIECWDSDDVANMGFSEALDALWALIVLEFAAKYTNLVCQLTHRVNEVVLEAPRLDARMAQRLLQAHYGLQLLHRQGAPGLDGTHIDKHIAEAALPMVLGHGCGHESEANTFVDVLSTLQELVGTHGIVAADRDVWMPELPGVFVDVLVRFDNGRQVAVLVEGTEHYASNDSTWRLGPSQLQHRLLQGILGEGNVVGVRVADWPVHSNMDNKLTHALGVLGLETAGQSK